jgi:hypothetical protein
MMAAVADIVRARWRLASRVAIRIASGALVAHRLATANRPGSTISPPRTRARPPMPTATATRVAVSRLDKYANVPPTLTAAPKIMHPIPRMGSPRRVRSTEPDPRSALTRSRRTKLRAGMTAATRHAARAHSSTATIGPTGISHGPDSPYVLLARVHRSMSQAAAMPSSRPHPADMPPSTIAWPRTRRRTWVRVAPLLAVSAKVRRDRAALTAKAGPASSVASTNSPRAMTASSTTRSDSLLPTWGWIRGSRSATSGGSVSTARLTMSIPWSFRRRTSGQVIGLSRSTSQTGGESGAMVVGGAKTSCAGALGQASERDRERPGPDDVGMTSAPRRCGRRTARPLWADRAEHPTR